MTKKWKREGARASNKRSRKLKIGTERENAALRKRGANKKLRCATKRLKVELEANKAMASSRPTAIMGDDVAGDIDDDAPPGEKSAEKLPKEEVASASASSSSKVDETTLPSTDKDNAAPEAKDNKETNTDDTSTPSSKSS